MAAHVKIRRRGRYVLPRNHSVKIVKPLPRAGVSRVRVGHHVRRRWHGCSPGDEVIVIGHFRRAQPAINRPALVERHTAIARHSHILPAIANSFIEGVKTLNRILSRGKPTLLQKIAHLRIAIPIAPHPSFVAATTLCQGSIGSEWKSEKPPRSEGVGCRSCRLGTPAHCPSLPLALENRRGRSSTRNY